MMEVIRMVEEECLFDLESERRVLSAMVHSTEACVEAYQALTREDFYYQQHQIIYDLVANLFERDIQPTYVELLKEAQVVDLFSTPQQLEELRYIVEQYIVEENISYWLKRIRDKSRLRKYERFLRLSYQTLNRAAQDDLDVEQTLMKAEEELTNLTALEMDDIIDDPQGLASLGYAEVERRFLRYKDIKERFRGVIPLDGLPTGFENLDNITLGYKPGDLIIIGAQTGHGKTAFALHTAGEIAVRQHLPLLYLNTEMSRVQIALRWGSILSQVEQEKIRRGDMTESELSRTLQAYSLLRESGFYSYPCPNLTQEVAISVARRFKVQHDIKMMVVDYVGRMDKVGGNLQEWQILEQIVKTLKMLAQNLNIAVMVLVQLNEDGTLQGARRMKNECDLLLKLEPIPKDEYLENEELRKYREANYYLFIDKNRDGVGGVRIPIMFDKARQTLRDAERVAL
ncbi:MAG: replicative DNA helicase [Methylocystaceae bacterium]